MIAAFKNSPISRILGVYSQGFLHITTRIWLKKRFWQVSFNFNFSPKLTTLHNGRFSKSSHFSNIRCFLTRFFAQNNSNVIKESFFACFFWILIFDPNWPFCKAYSLCAMADFQNRLISRIFGVFSSGFSHRTSLIWLNNRFFACFSEFEFLTQTDHFVKAFARWPIFKTVSFLEYLVFSQAVFCTEQP